MVVPVGASGHAGIVGVSIVVMVDIVIIGTVVSQNLIDFLDRMDLKYPYLICNPAPGD